MISPLSISTDGYLCENNTLSIATNGYICIRKQVTLLPEQDDGGHARKDKVKFEHKQVENRFLIEDEEILIILKSFVQCKN